MASTLPGPANVRRRLLLEFWPGRHDVFHGLNQRLPRNVNGRTVCTFHDLFVLTGEYSTPEFRRRFAAQARDAARRSDLIIAVSRFTASQVEAHLGVEQARIRVIPHGVRPIANRPQVANLPHNSEPFLLHVGGLQARKNVIRIIEAFEQCAPGLRLVLTGGDGYGAEQIKQRIEQSRRRSDIEITGYVDDARLADLYQRARMLVFPSLDEGFGIPVLEAMASGLPVLTSDRSALEEVAGGAALLVDPYDTEGIAQGIQRLSEDSELRAKLVRAGVKRAQQYRWEESVDLTWNVYRELC